MKKQPKDPRPTLFIFLTMSIVTSVFIPFFYINIKADKISKAILLLIVYVIIFLLIKKFYKKEEEYKLHDMITTGFAFSGVWLFIALCFIFAISVDYLKQNIFPKIEFLLGIAILLFFSFSLFYLSNKSKRYEKSKKK